jgi:hypothetical protein
VEAGKGVAVKKTSALSPNMLTAVGMQYSGSRSMADKTARSSSTLAGCVLFCKTAACTLAGGFWLLPDPGM